MVNMGKELITAHCYSWTITDGQGGADLTDEDTFLQIRAWCLDRESHPYLLRINNFPASCYIQLPRLVSGRNKTWDRTSLDIFCTWISSALGNDKPIGFNYKELPRIYFYYGEKSNQPMLHVNFSTLNAMKHCERLLAKPHRINDLGLVKCEVWETSINAVRKLLTKRKCGFSQWFTVEGTAVDPDCAISTLKREYIIDWDTITPLAPEVTGSWMSRPGVLAFDIETYSDNHKAFPNKYHALHVAYLLSAIYQRVGQPETRKRYTIIMGECDDLAEEGIEVIQVKTELQLVQAFADLVQKLDPEIVSGYNILGFDYSYLNARLERRGNEWPIMGRLKDVKTVMKSKVWKSSAYGHNKIDILQMEGRISIDMLPLVKRDYKLDKYDLDSVSRYFLGDEKGGKHDIKAPEMFAIYEALVKTKRELQRVEREGLDSTNQRVAYERAVKEMTRVTRYCVQDSELVIAIFEKMNAWIALVELSNIVGVSIMELFTAGQQIRCISQVYDLANTLGVVIDKREMKKVHFSGGFVYEPIPGLYENIICLDFSSLYPSIMIAYNICHSTLVPPELEDVIPDEMCNVIEFDQEEEDMEEDDDDSVIADGVDGEVEPKEKKEVKMVIKHYRYKFIKAEIKKGILPQLVQNLVNQRRAVRKQLDGVKDETGAWIIKPEADPILRIILDKRQLALKVSANSMFGFLGAQGGKLPLIEGARCITAIGRMLIGKVNKYLEEKYQARIVYNDSVSEDTPILIRRGGFIDYVRIGDLIDFTELDDRTDGKQEHFMNNEYVEVWSDVGWTRIKRVIRHKTNKLMYRVLTHTGCVDVTEDHSLLDTNGNMITPNQVHVGSELLHCDLPDNHVLSDMTREKAWLWGFFMAEGSCGCYNCPSGPRSSWAITNQNLSYLETAKDVASYYYPNFKFTILDTMESSNVYKLVATGTGIKEFIQEWRKLFYTGEATTLLKDSEKIVPMIIFNSSKEAKLGFLDGFYAGDGLKAANNLVWDQKGKIGSAGLYYLAKSIGYSVSINFRDGKDDIYRCTLTKSYQRKNPIAIKKLTCLGPCDSYVYDLETENHHFGAGVGCLVVHNTDSSMADLGITDPRQANQWGIRLAQEISGVKKGQKLWDGTIAQEDIKGLFPPPLGMEFEKAMRLLCLKKKKYAAFYVLKDGSFKLNKEGETDILKRGIVLARRDNCKYLRRIYNEVLVKILNRYPLQDALNIIIDTIQDLLQGKIDYRELLVVREVGNYAADSPYFMKAFVDELRRIGKPAQPGDRIEYLIADVPGVEKIGLKMRSLETYLEDQDNIKIDYFYYIDKQLKNPLDQLISIGYQETFKRIDEYFGKDVIGYKPNGTKKFVSLNQPIKMIARMIEDGQDIGVLKPFIAKVMEMLEPPKLKFFD